MRNFRKRGLPLAILLFAAISCCLILPSSFLLVDQQSLSKDDALIAGVPEQVALTNAKPTTTTARDATKSAQRCLISSRGSDGIGHQLESKISCIATAAALENELEYVHCPMNGNAEHGTDAASFESFLGIQQQSTGRNLKVLLTSEQSQFQVQKREPLPVVGKCRELSWFQPTIRLRQCQIANVTTVFVADNCWDFFYCALKRNENVIVMEQAMGRLRAGYMRQRRDNKSTDTAVDVAAVSDSSSLTVAVHIRRTDSGRRKLSSAYYSHLIRQLVDAARDLNDRTLLNIIIHTDQARASRQTLLPELSESYNVTIRDKSSVSIQTVFDEMVQADIFVTSRSSLSNAAALMGRQDRPVLYPFDKTRVGLSSLQGWTLLRQSGKDGMERFQRMEYAWQGIETDFYREVIADAKKANAHGA